MFRLLMLNVLTASLILTGLSAGAEPTIDDVFRFLDEHNVQADTNALNQSAVKAVLEGVDAHAEIIPSQEKDQFLQGETVAVAEEWPEGICYLKLNGLYEGGGKEVVERISGWTGTNRTGIILDIRGAEGNSLSSVDVIAGVFIVGGSALYEVREATNRTHTAQETSSSRTLPVMLAIDGMTAGASEVLAMVLKGKEGVMLIGERTARDCLFREILPLTEEYSLYISTGRIVPVGMTDYQHEGIIPDVGISKDESDPITIKPESPERPTSEQRLKYRELMQRAGDDAVLRRAADILLGLKAIGEGRVTE
jgi:C-terminal processing protease CtpA/Prc